MIKDSEIGEIKKMVEKEFPDDPAVHPTYS